MQEYRWYAKKDTIAIRWKEKMKKRKRNGKEEKYFESKEKVIFIKQEILAAQKRKFMHLM